MIKLASACRFPRAPISAIESIVFVGRLISNTQKSQHRRYFTVKRIAVVTDTAIQRTLPIKDVDSCPGGSTYLL